MFEYIPVDRIFEFKDPNAQKPRSSISIFVYYCAPIAAEQSERPPKADPYHIEKRKNSLSRCPESFCVNQSSQVSSKPNLTNTFHILVSSMVFWLCLFLLLYISLLYRCTKTKNLSVFSKFFQIFE